MPLGTPGFYGTNADGSDNHDWCRFCYQNGAYTEPELTLDEMISRSTEFMTISLKYTKDDAERLSRDIIPTLRRWTAA
jgi:hypothetical protein